MSRSSMVPLPQQWWQADASAAPAAEAQPTAETQPAANEAQPAAEETPTDIFANMFAELSKDEPVEPKKKPDETAGAEGTTTDDGKGALPDPKDVAQGDATQPEPKLGADGKPLPETKPDETKPAETKQPEPAKDPRLDQLLEAFTKQGKPEEQGRQQQPEPEKPYTAEEQQLVDTYNKEWPEIAQAEMLIRRTEYRALCNYIFGQVGPVLTQLMEHAQGVNQQQHHTAVTTAIPDYSDVAPQVTEWVSKQPPFLKAAYDAIIKQGTAEDVVQLVDTWKRATDYKPPATQQQQPVLGADGKPVQQAKPAAQQPQAKPAAQQPQAKPAPDKVIDALRAPQGRRTAVTTGGVPQDDYEGAFKVFAEAKD